MFRKIKNYEDCVYFIAGVRAYGFAIGGAHARLALVFAKDAPIQAETSVLRHSGAAVACFRANALGVCHAE